MQQLTPSRWRYPTLQHRIGRQRDISESAYISRSKPETLILPWKSSDPPIGQSGVGSGKIEAHRRLLEALAKHFVDGLHGGHPSQKGLRQAQDPRAVGKIGETAA